jgi:hypothetical protein
MPNCKICRTRIDVSQTGVRAFRCRLCGRTVCKFHFVPSKDLCTECDGISQEKISSKVRRFSSHIRGSQSALGGE